MSDSIAKISRMLFPRALRRPLCGLWIIASLSCVSAEEPEAASAGTAEDSTPTDVTVEAEEPPQEEASLLLQTMARDISTADYYALLAWCRRLELDDAGDRAALQDRLYRYYGVEADPRGEAASSRSVAVPQAGSVEYFSIEAAEEDYLLLQGDVIVEFLDREEDVLHRISARRIIVNRSENTLSAEGDVEYFLKRGDAKPEVFYSENFSFDLENWAGVFVEGRGETEREINKGEPVEFFFSGETISRRVNDVVLLERGDVTSCDEAQAPHWRISASRIYVLAPGEWAITDAVLYIGRIPLLYIPFFFMPGDEFFFHPSVGYRVREGWFIQTTSYLQGAPEKQDSAFSFLRVTEQGAAGVDREIRGLFLRVVEGEQDSEDRLRDVHILKLVADVYTRLGGFAGIVADYAPLWQLKGGLGVSRSLFPDAAGYTAFPDVDFESHWNAGRFFGLALPVRYGIEANLNLGRGNRSFSSRLEYYSDPFFAQDFYERSEKIDWTSLLQTQEFGSPPGVGGGWDLAPGLKESFTWQARSRLLFPFESSLVQQLRLQRFDVTLDWQSKYIPDYSDPLLEVDPNRKFFFPTRLIAPNLQASAGGRLIILPFSSKGSVDGAGQRETREPGRGYRLPAEEETGGGVPPDDEEIIVPSPQEDLPADVPKAGGSRYTLSYTILPRFLLENQFNHTTWFLPTDVDFAARYSALAASGTVTLLSDFSVGGGTLIGSHGLTFDGTYNTTFNRSADVSGEEWAGILEDDYGSSGVDLTSILDLRLFPLPASPAFRKTVIRYALDWDLYSRRLANEIAGDPAYDPWSAAAVSRHQLLGSLIFEPGGIPSSLELAAVLPPLDMSYRGTLDFPLGKLQTGISGGFREESGGWKADPLAITETLDFSPWAVVGEKVVLGWDATLLQEAATNLRLFRLHADDSRYLLEEELAFSPGSIPLGRSRTTLAWGSWEASFFAERRHALAFVGEDWVPVVGEERLLASRFLLGYGRTIGPALFWKNRIGLEAAVDASLDLDFQRFTQSVLNLSWSLNLRVHRFLDFSVSVVSWNRRLYRYVEPWAVMVGDTPVNMLEDLLRSFNFFNIADRMASSFNLKSVSLTAVHQLHDWDLSFDFNVRQVLQTGVDGKDRYVWMPIFNLLLEWQAIPELRQSIRKDERGISIRG